MSTYNSAYTGQQIDEAIGKAHTHSNEEILNNTTANYTAEEKNKLAGIEAGAEVNTVDSVNGKTGAVTLTIPSKTSDLTNDNGFITDYTETDPTVPSYVKNITSSDINNWNNKSDFSGSYNDLADTPTIPAKTSELENDGKFVNEEEVQTIINSKIQYSTEDLEAGVSELGTGVVYLVYEE